VRSESREKERGGERKKETYKLLLVLQVQSRIRLESNQTLKFATLPMLLVIVKVI